MPVDARFFTPPYLPIPAGDWGGRFIADHYGPLLPADSSTQDGASLGTILLPGHPLMQSVDSLATWHITHTGLTLAPSAYAVALWDNGEIMVAANPRSVAFNFIPVLGLDVPDALTTTGDLGELLHNAAALSAGIGILNRRAGSEYVACGWNGYAYSDIQFRRACHRCVYLQTLC